MSMCAHRRIQSLANTARMQEEFFHTFKALHGLDEADVIASDRPPKEWRKSKTAAFAFRMGAD